MAAKRTSKKGAPAKRRPAARRRPAAAGGTTVSIRGNIGAGRNVNIGDQYLDQRKQVIKINTAAEFVAGLEQLQAQIAALKQQEALTPAQAQTLEVVEGQIEEAVAEAQKPEPAGPRIVAMLNSARAVMDSLAGSLTAAVGLGVALAAFGQVALKLFGG